MLTGKDFKDKNIICKHCQKRPATTNWVGEGSMMDALHGQSVPWCDYCVTEYSLFYARQQAARIPELEKKLESLG